MKPNCILCGKLLKDTEERYIQYGNFCYECTSEISHLSNIYPGDRPTTMNMYKLEEWSNRKEYYEKKSELFQREVAKRLREKYAIMNQ